MTEGSLMGSLKSTMMLVKNYRYKHNANDNNDEDDNMKDSMMTWMLILMIMMRR